MSLAGRLRVLVNLCFPVGFTGWEPSLAGSYLHLSKPFLEWRGNPNLCERLLDLS